LVVFCFEVVVDVDEFLLVYGGDFGLVVEG